MAWRAPLGTRAVDLLVPDPLRLVVVVLAEIVDEGEARARTSARSVLRRQLVARLQCAHRHREADVALAAVHTEARALVVLDLGCALAVLACRAKVELHVHIGLRRVVRDLAPLVAQRVRVVAGHRLARAEGADAAAGRLMEGHGGSAVGTRARADARADGENLAERALRPVFGGLLAQQIKVARRALGQLARVVRDVGRRLARLGRATAAAAGAAARQLRASCRTSSLFSKGLRTESGDMPTILMPVVKSAVKGVPLPEKISRGEIWGGAMAGSSANSAVGRMRGTEEVSKRLRNASCQK